MNKRRLPPLKSLVYFEAAARLQSFTAASRLLNVTQGAVSRQIRQLELFLGRDLFLRERRQIFLTDDGHNYYVSISHLLEQLSDATENLIRPAESSEITLVTSSAIASMYLLPRIPAFRQNNPGIRIRIVARDNIDMLDNFAFDLAIYYSRTTPSAIESFALFEEEIFQVCSPSYFDSHLIAQDSEQQSIQLYDSNLIWLESQEDWINWPEWLEKMAINVGGFDNRLVVNHYSMVIQAAIAGQGVALAWSGLVDNEIEQGLLLRPLSHSLKTGANFYLLRPPDKTLKPAAITFESWLRNH